MRGVILFCVLDKHLTTFHQQKRKNIMKVLLLIRYVSEAVQFFYQGLYFSGHLGK